MPLGTPIIGWNTYYVLAIEDDFTGPQDTPIYDPNGNVIANVRSDFLRDFCVEGSGRLTDGRVVNFDSICNYGDVCSFSHVQQCYHVLDANRYPWGRGTGDHSITPLRSIAVDPSVIPLGSTVYIRQFDGVRIPSIDGIGGFRHDGCFRAEDTGGAIQGVHIDIFAGTRSMMHWLEQNVCDTHGCDLEMYVGGCIRSRTDAKKYALGAFIGAAAGAAIAIARSME